jgi:hypothetical protein
MAKYFTVSRGLRGCYMPDDCNVLRVDTRKELKAALLYDANDMLEAYGACELNKKQRTAFVALCWREAQKKNPAYLPYAMGFGHDKKSFPFGLFVSVATRAEYLEHCKEHENG